MLLLLGSYTAGFNNCVSPSGPSSVLYSSLSVANRMMVGRTISDERVVGTSQPGEVALDVRHLECGPLVRDVSFSVRRGEILGFAGLMGAGRTEVARAVFGADRPQSGEVYVHGKKRAIRTPEHAVAAGVGYLSEDRKRFGLALGMDVEANVVMSNLSRYLSFVGFLKSQPMRQATEKFIRLLNIRTPSTAQEVRLLSGGNQQKVVVAKWLDRDCDILFFDEPPEKQRTTFLFGIAAADTDDAVGGCPIRRLDDGVRPTCSFK